MSDTVRNVVPRISTASDPSFSPLIYFPVIGLYFEAKACIVVNKNIKALIEEEKRSVQINCVPQMIHLIELRREFNIMGRSRELLTIALVVAAFVTGYFPLILALVLSAIFGLLALGSNHVIDNCDKVIEGLEGRNAIPDNLLVTLRIK